MRQDPLTAETIIPYIQTIFEEYGADAYLGEDVTVAEHMLQAASVGEEKGYDETVIMAALLHDVGHFDMRAGTFSMDDEHDRVHEDTGADLLAPFFPKAVVDAVRLHVAAKRYLVATVPSYKDRLSDASIHSLKLQGGPMNEEEVKAFAQNPNLDTILKVRYLDEAGKMIDRDYHPLSYFLPRLEKMVKEHNQI